MDVFLARDANFRPLYEVAFNNRELEVPDIVTYMTRFRKRLSFAWVLSLPRKDEKKSDLTECLSEVIRTILQFTEHSDATVRVTAYSTLGGLLVTVAPFAPVWFIDSFGKAITGIDVSPKLSIAVINMFMYLTRFISPVRIDSFIVKLPVSPHFGVDVSDFIKYLPQVIPMMHDLPIDLLKMILRSLITGAGRKPSSAFVQTVTMLVEINRPVLLPVLISFIRENEADLANAAVWLGPALLPDPTVFENLSQDGRELFLDYALKEFNKTPLNLCQFEHACKTCAIFLEYARGTPEYEVLEKRIYGAMKPEYNDVYKARLLLLPSPLEKIDFSLSFEQDTFRGNKLGALATYFVENLETADADKVAQIFLDHKTSENDLYCTLVDSFAMCFEKMIERCHQDYHIQLLDYILRKRNKNWVHDEIVCKLIDSIPTERCQKVFSSYTELAMDRLLDATLSSQDRLFDTSIASMVKFASYSNLDVILHKIYESDWMSEHVLSRRFFLLAQLAELFDSSTFPAFFTEVALESLMGVTGTTTISNIYMYLCRVPLKDIPASIVKFSFEFLIDNYQVYSKKTVNTVGFRVPMTDKFFLDTLNTDIVTNPTVNHQDALVHMKNCYAFLCSLPEDRVPGEDLLHCSLRLGVLFDEFALNKALDLVKTRPEYHPAVFELAKETFKSTCRDEVVACCCRIFVNLQSEKLDIPGGIRADIVNFVKGDMSCDPDLLFFCLVLVDQRDHEKAVSAVPEIIRNLHVKRGSVLLSRLIPVIKDLDVASFGDEYAIAFLENALTNHGEAEEKVKKYIETVPFADWPLFDAKFTQSLIDFLKQMNTVIKVEDVTKLNDPHWRFLVNYKDMFDLTGVKEYMLDHPAQFAKINIAAFMDPPEEKVFTFEAVPPVLKIASIAPLVDQGLFVDSIPHIINYFRSASKPISAELFNKYLECAKQHKNKLAVKKILEFGLKTGAEAPSFEDDIFFEKSVIKVTMRWFYRFAKMDAIPKTIIERIEKSIGRKIEPELIHDPEYLHIVRLDTTYFMQYLLNQEEYRAHRFIPLFNLLTTTPVDPNILFTLIKKYAKQYPEMTSARKKAVFVRFLTCAVRCVRSQGRKKDKEFLYLINLVYHYMRKLTSGLYAPFYSEYAQLLNLVCTFTKETSRITSFIKDLTTKNAVFPLFLFTMTSLVMNRKENIPELSEKSLAKCLQTDRPSAVAAALRVIFLFLTPGSDPSFFKLAKKLAPKVQDVMPFSARDFRSGQVAIQLCGRMLVTSELNEIDNGFYIAYMDAFMRSRMLATFPLSLSLCAPLVKRIPEVFQVVTTCFFPSQELLTTITAVLETLMGTVDSPDKRELIQLAALKEFETYFFMFTSVRACELLLKLAMSSTDIASYFYSRLSMDSRVHRFLPLFCFLSRQFPKFDDPLRDNIAKVIDASTYTPKSRSLAMSMITDTSKSRSPSSFLLAAAETDDPEKILAEIESASA